MSELLDEFNEKFYKFNIVICHNVSVISMINFTYQIFAVLVQCLYAMHVFKIISFSIISKIHMGTMK